MNIVDIMFKNVFLYNTEYLINKMNYDMNIYIYIIINQLLEFKECMSIFRRPWVHFKIIIIHPAVLIRPTTTVYFRALLSINIGYISERKISFIKLLQEKSEKYPVFILLWRGKFFKSSASMQIVQLFSQYLFL